jgi:hypothetical protein
MRIKFPSNPVPGHIHPTHSAFYRTRHLEMPTSAFRSISSSGAFCPRLVVEFDGTTVGMSNDTLGDPDVPIATGSRLL